MLRYFVDTGIFLYPNPANNILYIDIRLPESSEVTWRIFDVTGREILPASKLNLNSGQTVIDMDISSLPSGKYFYKMETQGKVFNGGFIKIN